MPRPMWPPPTATPKPRARRPKARAISAAQARAPARAKPKPPKRAAREPLEAAEREVHRLSAEVKALGDLLHPEGEGLFPPLIDAVTVQSGYEAALAAAWATICRRRWTKPARITGAIWACSTPATPLPHGVKPLSDFVKAPAALARRLSMTGVVFPDQGAALQKQLKPGQRLVSARGDLWRWDGYAASADAPSPAAVRLSQRNRLAELEQETGRRQGRPRRCFAAWSAAKDARQCRARRGARRRGCRTQDRTKPDRGPGRKHPRRPRRRRTRQRSWPIWKRKSAAWNSR